MSDNTPVTSEPIYKFICEWCEPSDIPALSPQSCCILRCNKCGCETWHWPKQIVDEAEIKRAQAAVRQSIERVKQNQQIAEEMKRVKWERGVIRAFPYIVSLWGLMAQHIQPQPADTKIRVVYPGETTIREFEFTEDEIAWLDGPAKIGVKESYIRLEKLPLACKGTGTILDGLRVNVWHGYSPESNITYWWSEVKQ